MRKNFTLALLALTVLAGCATTGQGSGTGSGYGNFVAAATLDQAKLANDAVQQLAALYAPAQTRLEMQQATPDPFGTALVQGLRDKGYALVEYTPASAVKQAATTAANQVRETAAEVLDKPKTASAEGTAGLPLRYVLDQLDEQGLYRLTLIVGAQTITRPYLAHNGAFAPAGYWVRKE